MRKYTLIILITSILSVLVLLMIPDKNHEKEVKYQRSLYSSYLYINNHLDNGFKLLSENLISNNIKNVVYFNEETKEYASYFIDMNTGKLTNFSELITPGKILDFAAKEKELLSLKYPDFIVNGIYNSKTKRNIIVYPNLIKIYYKNVVTYPMYNEEISLVINNNEVSKFLNYDYELDDEYSNESAFDYDSSKKYVAFSFDDGPSNTNTVDIINYLKSTKSHATFFMLGSLMNRYPDIVKYALENGNEIGSHTYTHINLTRTKMDKIKGEIEATDNTYYSLTGSHINLLRPPYGSINNKIKDTFNYSYILWSVDTLDWKYRDADRLYDYVINNINDGDIILMHDIHESTKVGVEKILPELYVRGYRVVSVSELANIKGKVLEKNTSYRSMK